MFVPRPDRTLGESEWRPFVVAQGFGHLIAPGRDRDLPVVVPTQFVLDGPDVLLHLAVPNPVFAALEERPRALLSVAGDWTYVPTDWKAIGAEDPALGIPTTYYAAVQLSADVTVLDDPEQILDVLRAQLASTEPATAHADPAAHRSQLPGIRGLRLTVTDVRARFKFGGNVDAEHRDHVAQRLRDRGSAADLAALGHLRRREAATSAADPG